MRILVAGATGAIGRILLPLLEREGHEPVAMVRRGPGVVADALDRDAVHRAVEAVRPDAVIHQLTALKERDFAANARLRVEGTRNLVDAAKACGVERFVAQSIAFASAPGEGLAREQDPLFVDGPEPWGATARGVAALEGGVAELRRGVVLRYGILYGPATWNAHDGATAVAARSGAWTPSAGGVSFIHVEDAARAAAEALEWPAGVYNVVEPQAAFGAEWAPVFARHVGATPPARFADARPGERGASPARSAALGWTCSHDWRRELGAQEDA